jgi:hypothetical protein
MYKPNRNFMRQLKALDPSLGCEFNRDTNVFNVTYLRATGLPVPIMPVKTQDGKFRQPDQRELLTLGESDMTKIDRQTHLNKASKYCQEYREKQAKESTDMIKNRTLDDKRQLANAFGKLSGSGKFNSTFRRIEPKAKGQVF